MNKTSSQKIDNAADKTHEAVEKAAQLARIAELKALEASAKVRAKADETVANVKVVSDDAQQKVTEYVNANPIKSIGIAFGAGILASAFLRR